jgi:transcriptional regulator with XRE-family HTH domain
VDLELPLLGSLAACVPRAPTTQTIGLTIQQYRTQAGMSQEELAEKAELHPVYIGKIERGEQWISLHGLIRIAQALGVRVSELLQKL